MPRPILLGVRAPLLPKRQRPWPMGKTPPPTPVGSPGDITTLTLTHVGTQPFTVGQVFKKGDVPQGDAITLSCAQHQADVRNRWSDGSVRFAVLSGVAPSGNITISKNGTPYSASNVAEPSVAAVVAFTSVVDASSNPVAGGSFSASLADARAAGAKTWTSSADRTTPGLIRSILGPVMSEFHYFVPTADAHTHVWFYVRAYSTGQVEIETVVENGWFSVASPGRRNYTATVTIGGTTRFGPQAVQHYHHTRWSRVDWVGTDPAVVPKHDVSYLQSTKIFPKLAVSSLNASFYTNRPEASNANTPKYSGWTRALAEQPTPFSYPNVGTVMGDGGVSDFVALFGPWDMAYLVDGDPRTYWAVQGNARRAGYFCGHYRDENEGIPVRVSQRQAFSLNTTNGGGFAASGSGTLTPEPAGGTPSSTWARTHAPSLSFGAYLLSGRWTALESTQFFAAVTPFEGHSGFNYGGYRILRNNGAVQLRGWAWDTRLLAQAAIATPEYLNNTAVSGSDAASRTEAVGRFDAHIAYWKATYVDGTVIASPQNNSSPNHVAMANNAFGIVYNHDYLYSGTFHVGGLQEGAAQCVILWAAQTGALTTSGLLPFAAFLARHPFGMSGGIGSSWNWQLSNYYTMDFGTFTGAADGITLRASWDAQWTYLNTKSWTLAPSAIPDDNCLYDGGDSQGAHAAGTANAGAAKLSNFGSSGGGSDLYMHATSLAMAYEVAQLTTVTGATTAADNFYGSDTYTTSTTGHFKDDPTFAYVAPSYVAASPAWMSGKPLNEWFQVGVSEAGGSAVWAYCGMSQDLGNARLWIAAAGGHGNSYDNRVVSLNLLDDAPSWAIATNQSGVMDGSPTPLNQITGPVNGTNGTSHYLDGKPTSRHTYWDTFYVPSQTRVMLIGCPVGYSGPGNEYLNVDAFNTTTNTWDAANTWAPTTASGIYKKFGHVIHPTTEEVWYLGKNGSGEPVIGKWTAAGGMTVLRTWNDITNNQHFCSAGAWDTTRNQLFNFGIGDGYANGVTAEASELRAWKISADGQTRTAITFNPSSALNQLQTEKPEHHGLAYDPENDCFLFVGQRGDAGTGANGTIYKITPNSGSVWDVSFWPLGGGTLTPTFSGGAYTRLMYVPRLKGFVFQDVNSGNSALHLYFMRTA